jgi:hypothetical protein
MIRTILVLLVYVLACFDLSGQETKKSIRLEAIGSAFFPSDRHFYYNGDDGVYYEIRVGYPVGKYCEVNISGGYVKRSFIYFAKFSNGSETPLFMDRFYIPVAASFRVYLSDFFYEKLKLWKKQYKWDIYVQLGLVVLQGHDKNDERDAYFQGLGATVPYYKYPYEQEYGAVYPSYLLGLRYNFNKNIGLFLEGGDGSFATLQSGLSFKF